MNLKDLLNERQYEAVSSSKQYLRIVAGAGSGKTRVLTYRIAYLINEWRVPSWKILAITFTNKVAKEMSDRVKRILQDEKVDTQIRTFHSFAAYFLRQEIDAIGYPSSFTILDEEDQLTLIKDIASQRGHKRNSEVVKLAVNYIASNKLREQYPDDIHYGGYDTIPYEKECLEIYRIYEEKKTSMHALDFDDLLLKANYILENFPHIRMKWANKYDHILIDEFQDTNNTEYKLINYLMNSDTYLYVVGDPDQTIYTWRGANQNIIIDMDKKFSRIETIILDRNYRSTQTILDAANKLIAHNKMRVPKNLYTENERGDSIIAKALTKNTQEAEFIAKEIKKLTQINGYSYNDISILYRSNYVTQEIEQALVNYQIPYKIFGATKFYQRAEIKDLIAFFNLVVNTRDDISFERIINIPRRKIGSQTILDIKQEAGNQPLYEYVKNVEMDKSEVNKAALAKLKALVLRIDILREDINKNEKLLNMYLNDFVNEIGYISYLDEVYKEDADDRKDNIFALLGNIQNYMNNPDATFNDYLQNIALLSAQDDVISGDFVTLMTVHTAKGLEFPIVFIARLNANVFPSARSLEEGYKGLEEERRLCYVAMTRAMNKLYMLMTNGYVFSGGSMSYGEPSQFFKESGVEIIRPERSYGESNKPRIRSYHEFDSSNYSDLESAISQRKGPMIEEVQQDSPNPINNSNGVEWKIGDIVIHKSLGKGVVLEVIEKVIKVDFEKFGVKLIMGNHPSVKKGE